MSIRLTGIGLSVGMLALGAVCYAQGPGRAKAKPGAAKPVAKKVVAKKAVTHRVGHRVVHHRVVRHHWVARKRAASGGHVSVEGAESELIGVRLYDPMTRVLDLFGSPDEIQPLAVGAGAGQGTPNFGGAGFGAPGRGGGFGGGMRGGARTPGGPGTGAADFDDPFGMGDIPAGDAVPANQLPPPGMPPGGPGGGKPLPGVPRGGGPGGRPGFPGGGPPGGYPGGPGGYPGGGPGGYPGGPGAPGGMAPGANAAAEQATYTRWVYNRNDNKYGFVVDKNGRVIEIEAIGITNPKVRTRRGVSFGTEFGTIIRRYHDPDGYDIAGDNITMRYLVHDKVAFKLTRMGAKQPHQVTGIVIAAGKP